MLLLITDASFKEERRCYFQNLAQIINSAAILYNLDKLIVCGGLTDAANACNHPLEQILNNHLHDIPPELNSSVITIVSRDGNRLQLIGALSLAKGESIALQNKTIPSYNDLFTEKPYRNDIHL